MLEVVIAQTSTFDKLNLVVHALNKAARNTSKKVAQDRRCRIVTKMVNRLRALYSTFAIHTSQLSTLLLEEPLFIINKSLTKSGCTMQTSFRLPQHR